MRILLCTNRDLASIYAVNLLLKELGRAHEWRIFVSEPAKPMPAQLNELEFAEQDLPNRLLFPLLARLPGRAELVNLERLSAEYGIPLHSVRRLDDPATWAVAEGFEPDLILSVRFRKIFKGPYLQLAPLGILNLHSGPLPEYRGVMATFWAMLNGEDHIGCSLHAIDQDSIDTGPVVARARLPRDPAKSLFANIQSLYPEGVRLIAQAVRKLSAGEALTADPQASGQARYYSLPTAEDVARFRAQGLSLSAPNEALAFLERFVPLNLRVATGLDAPALTELVNAAYRGDSGRRGWTTESDLLGGQRVDVETMAADIAKPQVRVLVAEGLREIKGCLYLERREQGCYIGLVTVRPELQNQGLGRQLLEEAELVARRDWGALKAEMSVIPLRAELLAWYERRGYRRTGRTLPFPAYADTRFGVPQRSDLTLEVLEKDFE